MVLSLTLMPVLASLGLGSKAEEREVWLIRTLKFFYTPVLDAVIRRPAVAAVLAIGLVGVSVPIRCWFRKDWSCGSAAMMAVRDRPSVVHCVLLVNA